MSRNLTYDQALCMFFCEEYNADNVMMLNKRLEDMGDVVLCYDIYQEYPLLVSYKRLYAHSWKYSRYPKEIKKVVKQEAKE